VFVPLDDRELAARKHDGTTVGAANECAITRRDVNDTLAAFGGEVFSDAIEFAALQARKQVGAVGDTAIIVALGQATSDQVLLWRCSRCPKPMGAVSTRCRPTNRRSSQVAASAAT
jgi:hypothetical protein